jgi:hypothetical protein
MASRGPLGPVDLRQSRAGTPTRACGVPIFMAIVSVVVVVAGSTDINFECAAINIVDAFTDIGFEGAYINIVDAFTDIDFEGAYITFEGAAIDIVP